jgi:uncharacterized protein YacL
MADDRFGPFDPEVDARRRKSLILILRGVMLVLMAAVALLAVLRGGAGAEGAVTDRLVAFWPAAIGFAFVLFALVIAIDVFTPVKKISTIGGVFLGLLAGILGAVAIGFVLELLAETYELGGDPIIAAIKVLIGIALCYLGISIVLQTQDDFRLIIPYVEFAKQMRGVRPLLLDSSALIDGRIVDVAEVGMIQAPIIVPRFVLAELQLLADSSDRMKRARGRRGLDIVTRLQKAPRLDVSVDDFATAGKGVDSALVEVASALNAVIVTTDTGLGRVAKIQSIPILNVNDLANALKPNVIPGESLTLQVMKQGEQAGQGVGYLDDGTMVVVEDGARWIGKVVTISVTSSMQTSAGRLIFGRVGESGPPAASPEHEPVGAGARRQDDDDSGPIGPHAGEDGGRQRPSRRNPRRG